MKSTMRPIHSLISSNFHDRAKNIQSLTASIHSRLSLNLREHCWVTGINGNNLLIITDKAERATTLRYQQHELLKQVNEEFSSTLETPLRRLKVKVDYSLSTVVNRNTKRTSRRKLEVETAKTYCNHMLDLLKSE